MKVNPISVQKNCSNTTCKNISTKGHPAINGGGGIIPDSIIYGSAKGAAEGAAGASLGWLGVIVGAILGIGTLLAHHADELTREGKLDPNDVYNPERDRMYM